MRPGSHAAGDGSFGRSAGINVGKAVALVAIAVVIGAVLLHRSGSPVSVSASGETSTTAKKASKSKSTTTTPPPPVTTATTQPQRALSTVKVLVANGTSVGGQAAFYSNKLHGSGYDTLASTNTFPGSRPQASIIYYAPNFQPEAAAIAQLLGLQAGAVKPMPAELPVANLQGANILVVIGPDLASHGGTTATTRHA